MIAVGVDDGDDVRREVLWPVLRRTLANPFG
jgi:hypothetical protein